MTWGLFSIPYVSLFGVAAFILFQADRRVIHPSYWPLLGMLIAIFSFPLIAMVRSILLRKTNKMSVVMASASALPAMAITVFGVIGIATEGRAFERSSSLHIILEFGGAALGEAHAQLFYGHSIESERVVMYFDRLEMPEQDLMAADTHLQEMEAYTGRKLREKIHFVRGQVLGLEHQILLGLTLGTKQSPRSWEKVTPPLVPGSEGYKLNSFRDESGMLDRHELAHAFLRQFVRSDASWPAALSEGWAMNWSGIRDRCWLIRSALIEREKLPALRGSIAGDSYLNANHKLYNFWGGFVFFLLEKFGFERFFRLYSTLQRDTFFEDFKLIYGRSLEELEKDFWQFGVERCQERVS